MPREAVLPTLEQHWLPLATNKQLSLAIRLPTLAEREAAGSWAALPGLVLQHVAAAGHWLDVKSMRLVCSSWRAAVDLSIETLRPRCLEVWQHVHSLLLSRPYFSIRVLCFGRRI